MTTTLFELSMLLEDSKPSKLLAMKMIEFTANGTLMRGLELSETF